MLVLHKITNKQALFQLCGGKYDVKMSLKHG